MKSTLALAGAVLMASSGAAAAQTYKGVGFVGGSVGEGASVYVGGTFALPGAQLGRGLGIRGVVSGGSYNYRRGGTTFDAEYVGGEVALVSQHSGAWGWANISAGPRVNHLSLSPIDLESNRRGTRFDLGFQTDGAYNLSSTVRAGWLASVGIFDGAYQVRGDIGHLISEPSQTRIGVETGLQGDPEYKTVNAGAFVGTRLSNNLEGRLAAGITEQAGRGAKPYASVGVSTLL